MYLVKWTEHGSSNIGIGEQTATKEEHGLAEPHFFADCRRRPSLIYTPGIHLTTISYYTLYGGVGVDTINRLTENKAVLDLQKVRHMKA